MYFLDLLKHKSPTAESTKVGLVSQPADTSGLVVTTELDNALTECKAKVERIAKECREQNCKFCSRHPSSSFGFDLALMFYQGTSNLIWKATGKRACLNGLLPFSGTDFPSDVLRCTQIWDEPKLFVDGADSNNIVQGQLGNCWFLSALSTMTTSKGLVEKFCVATSSARNNHSYLFTTIPKFEQLHPALKIFYHNDQTLYNKSARKGSHNLFFARSAVEGETWVPMIEKRISRGGYRVSFRGRHYARLDGSAIIDGSQDILDIDKFWSDELMNVNQDRLFGCSFAGVEKFGLFGSKGKRWLVIRNPWGASEWTGAWPDGSKEWDADSFDLLPLLGHRFGNDGQFVMEYTDFLECWDEIERLQGIWVLHGLMVMSAVRTLQLAKVVIGSLMVQLAVTVTIREFTFRLAKRACARANGLVRAWV
ncbi:hypothetical protein C8J57DRAFT_1227863 [Mycena rebaudengoi]|nr:hypothetical protein C8J57DRAFT_1227863 [Mycena rebaudengoi]